jgi:hypothetical protein
MKLFGQVVRTLVNVAVLPVEVARDALTGGGGLVGDNEDLRLRDTYTAKRLRKLKDEAQED